MKIALKDHVLDIQNPEAVEYGNGQVRYDIVGTVPGDSYCIFDERSHFTCAVGFSPEFRVTCTMTNDDGVVRSSLTVAENLSSGSDAAPATKDAKVSAKPVKAKSKANKS